MIVMLKIKDNIDLKELERYGFEENSFYYSKILDFEYYKVKIDVEKDRKYLIIQNDYYDNNYACYIPSLIYDLIKANLVEKVESDE